MHRYLSIFTSKAKSTTLTPKGWVTAIAARLTEDGWAVITARITTHHLTFRYALYIFFSSESELVPQYF